MAQGPQVTVEGGIIEGVDSSGVKIFRGVPYAAPPVGNLRWRNPQPVVAWQGVRSAKEFGANPIQKNAFGDMVFGTKKFSEDCLYLNIWTPTKNYNEKLPVLIYFNGGGFTSGSGSEPRYQGLTLARKGVIIVTVNYREGIFGGFASTLLSKENSKNEGYKGSGNQGLMDQAAAINWVHRNIAAFGGDPSRITICGESAGSSSVNAQQTSMMARGSFSQLIGSSASILSNTPMNTLADAEKAGDAFMKAAGCKTLAQLRSLPAEKINELYKPTGYPLFCIDGKFFTEQPSETYRKGTYAQVPALVGNNNCEVPVMIFMGGKAPTLENLKPFIKQRFKTEDVDKILNLYNIHSDADIVNRPGYELVATSSWLTPHGNGWMPCVRLQRLLSIVISTAILVPPTIFPKTRNRVSLVAHQIRSLMLPFCLPTQALYIPPTLSTQWATSPPTTCSSGMRTTIRSLRSSSRFISTSSRPATPMVSAYRSGIPSMARPQCL